MKRFITITVGPKLHVNLCKFFIMHLYYSTAKKVLITGTQCILLLSDVNIRIFARVYVLHDLELLSLDRKLFYAILTKVILNC